MAQGAPEARFLDPARIKYAADQFYWIAGLSLVNLILFAADIGMIFPIGLALAQLPIALAVGGDIWFRAAMSLIAVLVTALFVLCGVFARRQAGWAFIAGISLYVLDGAVWAVLGDWVSVGFHVLILFFLFRALVPVKRQAP